MVNELYTNALLAYISITNICLNKKFGQFIFRNEVLKKKLINKTRQYNTLVLLNSILF